MSIRKKLIAGNWKMNKTSADASILVQEIVTEVGKQTDVEVIVCPPFTSLESAGKALDGSSVKLGAQNFHHEKSGAFTGEISAEMLRSLYVTHVILGARVVDESGRKRLEVRVEDDGAGLKLGMGEGTGLANIRTQLLTRFASAASLELSGRGAGGVLARLVLPLEPAPA